MTAVMRRALLDALGLPSLVLLAGMTGFGSLAKESGLSLMMALTSTAGIWALPGQIALAELYGAGASASAIILAVAFANVRFLPMAASFSPLLREAAKRPRLLYLSVHLLSINSWAAGLRVFPTLPTAHRFYYFVPFALMCLASGLVGTTAGYFLVDTLPHPIALGLLFLNPVFFAVLLLSIPGRHVAISLVIGAVLGPLTFLVLPQWSLLITGLAGGSAAFIGSSGRT
jgi:predicted branched-subunit amino acid permease